MEWWSDLVKCSLLEHGKVNTHTLASRLDIDVDIATAIDVDTDKARPPGLTCPGQNHARIHAVPDCSRGPTLDSLIQCGGWSGSPDPYPHLHLLLTVWYPTDCLTLLERVWASPIGRLACAVVLLDRCWLVSVRCRKWCSHMRCVVSLYHLVIDVCVSPQGGAEL